MIDYMKEWRVDDDIIDMATTHFDDAIHGIEDHLQHYYIEVEV